MLLDEDARVLNVNRSLSGTSFASISDAEYQPLHRQLHPDCDGKCKFKDFWTRAWAGLETRDSIEWELHDPLLEQLLRLNLSRSPTPQNINYDRRRRHAILTITDITKYRHEYESLIEREQVLVKLLLEQGVRLRDFGDADFDEKGDTGNRLMAGYAKKERSSSRQVILAQENERKRIASDLHDGIAQTIGVVKYNIEASVARLVEQNPDMDVSMFDSSIDQLKAAVDEVRRISNNLAPSMLEDFGVCVALDWLCNEFTTHHAKVSAFCSTCIDEGDTSDLVKIAIYRVVQEALNNSSKHATATRIDVSLDATGERIRLIIADNGSGFDLQAARRSITGKSGLGLSGMRERVEATGGTFDIESAPGQGVVICAKWAVTSMETIEKGTRSGSHKP